MTYNIQDIKGFWRGSIEIDGVQWTVDFHVLHPETSFFTVVSGSRINTEWQAKPSLHLLDNQTWKFELHELEHPIPEEHARYGNLTLWQVRNDNITVQLGDGKRITLRKMHGE